MFKFLKSGIEFNNLAKSLNGMNVMLQELVPKIESNPSQDDHGESILVLSYIAAKGVDERIEKFGWTMDARIIVPSIKRGYIPLMYAYQQTVGKLMMISKMLDMDREVDEILTRGEMFRKLENWLPRELTENA